MLQSVKIPLQDLLTLKRVNTNLPVCFISKRVHLTLASKLLINTLNTTSLGLNLRNTAGDQSPHSLQPFELCPSARPSPAHWGMSRGGQLVHKGAVRYSMKSLPKIQTRATPFPSSTRWVLWSLLGQNYRTHPTKKLNNESFNTGLSNTILDKTFALLSNEELWSLLDTAMQIYFSLVSNVVQISFSNSYSPTVNLEILWKRNEKEFLLLLLPNWQVKRHAWYKEKSDINKEFVCKKDCMYKFIYICCLK